MNQGCSTRIAPCHNNTICTTSSSRTSSTTLYLLAHLAVQILDVCLSRPSTSPSTSHALASKKLTQSIHPTSQSETAADLHGVNNTKSSLSLIKSSTQVCSFNCLFITKDEPSSVWRHVHELFIQDVCRGMLHLKVAKSCQLIHYIPTTSTCRL